MFDIYLLSCNTPHFCKQNILHKYINKLTSLISLFTYENCNPFLSIDLDEIKKKNTELYSKLYSELKINRRRRNIEQNIYTFAKTIKI